MIDTMEKAMIDSREMCVHRKKPHHDCIHYTISAPAEAPRTGISRPKQKIEKGYPSESILFIQMDEPARLSS